MVNSGIGFAAGVVGAASVADRLRADSRKVAATRGSVRFIVFSLVSDAAAFLRTASSCVNAMSAACDGLQLISQSMPGNFTYLLKRILRRRRDRSGWSVDNPIASVGVTSFPHDFIAPSQQSS